MGACSSCLGRRRKDTYDEGEENRLLYEDGNGMQYGSFGDAAGDDTLEAQRETEALQRVVAKTSNNMVDVFEIAPHDTLTRGGTPFAYAGQGARVARYQHLVSKLSADDEADAAGVRIDWLAEDDDAADVQSDRPASIKTLPEENGGTLVGTFADAAAAMQ